MKKQRLLKIVQPILSAESGRSMVEMLGVLAIIGVLSIGAVAGYKFALNKFRANEIINELNARALSVSAQMLSATTPYESDEVIEDGFGNTLAVGYSAESAVSSQNPEYFEITINGIPSEVCTQILRDYENPIMIFVNEVRYNNDTSLCTTESGTVDMGFIYRRDLGERETCSEKGYFGEEDFICHCAGNTYIDPNNPNACLCPAGHVWSAESGEHGECIESICPEGYFESATNGCVPCSDQKNHKLASGDKYKQLCNACPNRTSLSTYAWCVNKDLCPLGSGFYTAEPTPWCSPCTTSWVDGSDYSQQGCLACSMYINKNICVKEITCTNNQFKNLRGKCQDCNTPDTIEIGPDSRHINACLACRNDQGIANRSVTTGWDETIKYCAKTVCESNEFMGSDGKCYACDNPKSVTVKENSGCESALCNREIINGKCQIKTCPNTTHVQTSDGSCYECGGSSSFNATKTECDTCSRGWLGDSSTPEKASLCTPLCVKGEAYPSGSEYHCYGCVSKSGSQHCGGSDYARDYCEACGGHVTGDFCMLPDTCQTKRGSHFRVIQDWSYQHCYSCDLADKKLIGAHESERGFCSACTTAKRFWAGSYCYRCDTLETPDVILDDEISACTSCPEREVKDGKCHLKQ